MSKKGFTLIELVIVIVIIGILATVSVPIYKGYIRRARVSEGRMLVAAVAKAEKVYYAEHGSYCTAANASNNDLLSVDASTNKYFTLYGVPSANSSSFHVWTYGSGDAEGITLEYIQESAAGPTISEYGM